MISSFESLMKQITRPFSQIQAITSREYPKMKKMMKTLQEPMEIITLKSKNGPLFLNNENQENTK